MTLDSRLNPQIHKPCLKGRGKPDALSRGELHQRHHVEIEDVISATCDAITIISQETQHHGPAPRFSKLAITPATTHYFRWKGAIDRVLASLILVPALPAVLCLAVLVRLTSPGPGLFRQRRVGKDGRCFDMFKLRSMRSDAEKSTGAVWSQPGDPRVTLLGRILRKLHLDEVPQLFHVLRGEMSLVGPRPERPEFVHVLAEQIPGYCNRLAVLPGVTGLAQVNLPPDNDIDSVRKKLILDLDYIDRGSLWLDLRIILCTVGNMVHVPLYRVLGLHRSVQLSGVPEHPADSRDGADISAATDLFASESPDHPPTASGDHTKRRGRRRKPTRAK